MSKIIKAPPIISVDIYFYLYKMVGEDILSLKWTYSGQIGKAKSDYIIFKYILRRDKLNTLS